MKAEFLRHEYTWSRDSISGTTGLGIVSSSTPKNRDQLRELEKMASMAEADSETGSEVELLMYHAQTGFVKMAVKPAPAAEDQRENKRVCLYQCLDSKTIDPAIYCLPEGSWDPAKGPELPMVCVEKEWDSVKNILLRYQCADKLPEFFRAVFWCVFRGSKNLAFVVPWPQSIAASNSRELMYAIHSILPENLRKNAGYASCGCGMNQRSSFYFTQRKPEDHYYDFLSQEYVEHTVSVDALDEFFYEKLATIYWEQDALYHQFLILMQETVGERKVDPNLLREIQWLFLQFCIQNMMDIPSFQEIYKLCPQLFYIASESETLKEVQDNLLEYYHIGNWSREEYESYLQVLESGFTKKGGEKILEEMEWVLEGYSEKYPKICRDYMEHFKQTNPTLYSRYMVRFAFVDNTIPQKHFIESKETMESMIDYVRDIDGKMITETMKDEWMLRGIELLNADVFAVESFEKFSEIVDALDRKQQWIQILSEFLQQLHNRKEELSESQIVALDAIERIYRELKKTDPEEIQHLKIQEKIQENGNHYFAETEKGHSQIPKRKKRTSDKKEWKKEEEVNNRMKKNSVKRELPVVESQEIYRTVEADLEKQGFFPFLLRGMPYGFLTGCVLFLVNYGFALGHWKISLGAGGMWLIMILNYATDRMEKRKKDGFRLWMAIGLSIVEGYIIHVIAWVFIPKIYRVYFFLGLGILTVILQFIQAILIRICSDKKEEA